MIKITGRLWLLVLCLSLIVSIPLASADEQGDISGGKQLYSSGDRVKDLAGSSENAQTEKKTWVCSSCGKKYFSDAPPDKCSNEDCENPAEGFKEEEVPTEPKTAPSNDNEKPTAEISDSKNEDPKPKDSGYGIFYLILVAVLGILNFLCISLIFLKINPRLSTVEKKLKKIAPPKSEGSTELNTNQPKGNDLQLEERVSELERVVSELKEVVRYLLRESETLKKENKEEQRPQESSRWRSLHREIPANNQRIHTENTTRPDQLSNKGISTYSTSNKSGLISGTNRGLGLSSEIQKIIVAFNKMMLDSTKLDEGSVDLWRLRNNFIKDYKVIAFKCVNSQERVNRPEEQPRFESCQASESTLWRIQLSDGTFAVLPGLREYESTVHLQGGMKELFKSGYTSGTYRKIEVVRPAIVRQNFNIAEQGELRLSQ